MKNKTAIQHLFILLLAILLCQVAYGQHSYRAGYVTTTDGRVQNGYIYRINWKSSPTQLQFKQTLDQAATAYPLSVVQQFRRGKEVYLQATVQDTVRWLRTIYEGEKSLYQHTNSDEIKLYIRQDGQYEYLRPTSQPNYIAQLSEYLSGCPSLQARIQKATYKLGAIEILFDRYYHCLNPQLGGRRASNRPFELGVVLGMNHATLRLKGYAISQLASLSYPSSIRPSCGIYIDFLFSKTKNRLSLYNELNLSNYWTYARHSNYQNRDAFISTEVLFNYSYLKLFNALRYKVSSGSVGAFVHGGLTTGLAVKVDNLKRVRRQTFLVHTVVVSPAMVNPRSMEYGLAVGTGVSYKSFSLEGRYEISTGMANQPGASSSVSRFYVLLGHSFLRNKRYKTKSTFF